MRRLILTGLGCILLISSTSLAGDFKVGSEPDGFRGISWGAEITKLSGFKLIRREEQFGGLDIYSRKGDKLDAWGVPVGAIEYFFRKGKFFRGNVLTAGIGDYRNLRKAVFTEFGVGELSPQVAPGVTQFIWEGKITLMILQIEASSASGSLLISSREMEDRMLEEGEAL
jgi:hypothetical protein